VDCVNDHLVVAVTDRSLVFSKLSPRNGNHGESHAVALSPQRRTPEGVIDAIGDWIQGRDADFDRIWIACPDLALHRGLATVLKTAVGPGWLGRVALQSGGDGLAAHDVPQDAVARPKNRRSILAMGGAAIAGAAAASVGSSIVRGLGSKGSAPEGAPPMRSNVGTGESAGIVDLDSFAGANDDAKLTAALTYAAAQTYKPTIQLPARSITFNTAGRTPYNGMRIIGPHGASGPKNIEVSPSNQNHIVNLNVGTGHNSWFNGTTTYYDIYIADIAFQNGGVDGQFWHQPLATAPGLYACQFHSLDFYGFQYIFGSPVTQCALTQVTFSGHWTVIGFVGTPFSLVFSDCDFWGGGYLNIGTLATAPSPGTPYITLNGGKTRVGQIYVTTINTWSGVNLVGGAGVAGAIYSPIIEGTSANPAAYPLVNISGGDWTIYSGLFDYVNPAAGVDGIITQSGGNLSLEHPRYLRYSGCSASFPLVYQTGGTCMITDAVALQSGETCKFRESDGTTIDAPPGSIVYH
jgi:hypothetical protein